MTDQPTESFTLDIEPTEAFLCKVSATIRRERARTANKVVLTLVWGLVLSLPFYVTAVCFQPDAATQLADIFGKWYTVVSPLAGAAIGAYYGARGQPTPSDLDHG